MSTDKGLYYKLNQAQHLLSKLLDAELKSALGVKTVQLGAVLFLMEHDGCMLKEISKGLGLNNSAITTLVARMEKGGLLVREPCLADGRSYRIRLTQRAKTIGQKGISVAKELNAILVQGFSDEEIAIVFRFLDSIIAIAKGE